MLIPSSPSEFRQKIWDDPEWFFDKILDVKYWRKTLEIADALKHNQRISLSGCTGSSKTYSAACIVPWWILSQENSRVITLAPGFRQVGMNIWGYIHQVIGGAHKRIGGKLLETKWEISKEQYAIGFSSDDPNTVHGIHGKNDLIILDDAHGIPKEIFDALENVMAGGTAKSLLLFNKNCSSGEAYDSCHSKSGLYKHIGVPAFETPNVRAAKPVWEKFREANKGVSLLELIARFRQEVEPATIRVPGMIVLSQVLQWGHTYGADSDYYRVYVEDKFPKQSRDVLIPNDWIEQAITREVPNEGKMVLGCDVGRSGDRSTILPKKGRKVFNPRVFDGFIRTTETAGEIIKVTDDLNSRCAFVDVIGVGSGVVDCLHESKRKVVGVNAASKSKVLKDQYDVNKGFKFSNLRAELWWGLREALDPKNPEAISLPDHPDLRIELSSIKYWHNSKGEIVIEPKDEMKVRVGRSPDIADGLTLAVWGSKQIEGGEDGLVTTGSNSDDEDDDD